jgi:dolichyl-phosphate-mannose-protein mannosyltransferase
LKRNGFVLICFIAVKFLLQYVLINPVYDLQRDEYLHLDQGKHLAWGFISVPPVTSWISFVINLLGNGIFWVKFFPALFGVLTMIVIWKIIEELKGGLFALILASTALLVSPILRINILFQPNSLDIFFWSLVYFTIIKYVNSDNSKWLYGAAIASAFGILSKYNILFLAAGLLPALLLTGSRKIFLNKNLYMAGGITLLIILPNVLWQYKNNFPTFHQLQELSDTQLVNVNRFDFVKDQFLFFISSLFIIIASFVAFFFYKPFKKFRFVFCSYIFTMSLFILLKAKSYYAIGLYPVLIAFGSVYLEYVFNFGWKKYLKPVSLAVVLILSIPFFLIGFPVRSPEQILKHIEPYRKLGLLRWEDGREHNLPQDFADMLGWKELAGKVDSIYNTVPEKNYTLVLCDNYGEAGAINYYSAFKNINAVSYNADYMNWIPLDKEIKNIIRVKEAEVAESDLQKCTPLFEIAKITGKIQNPDAREFGTSVLLLQGAKTDINKIIAKDIKERNNWMN